MILINPETMYRALTASQTMFCRKNLLSNWISIHFLFFLFSTQAWI